MHAKGRYAVVLVALSMGWVTGGLSAASPNTPRARRDDTDPGRITALTDELQLATGHRAVVVLRPETGAATFLGGSPQHPLAPATNDDPSLAARRFIDRYGALFGVDDPKRDLAENRVVDGLDGSTSVRFQQRLDGIPVLAGEIAVQLAADGSVLSTSGETVPWLDVATTSPTVTAATAAGAARVVTAKRDGAGIDVLAASAPELTIYDPALLGAGGPPGARLVWRVDVRTQLGDVDRLVLIDATTGAVALDFNQRHDALNRQVCNANNQNLQVPCTAPVRVEGSPDYTGSGSGQVNPAYNQTKVTYDFYKNRFGRDSVDGAGMVLKSTVLFCPSQLPGGCPYPNAFWNGAQMVYGKDFVVDDVVGHELTHGVTQFTSDLMYYAESGAINESMSDVMGELIDLSSALSGADPPEHRWQLGERLTGGALRDMSDPTLFGDPDRMTSPLFFGSSNDSHGVHTNSGVNNKAAFLITDGGTFNGQTVTGLGLDKAALIYYQAETTLLGPGSDYLDLARVLPQACTNLVGTAGITAADCAQVGKAVTATEMHLAPVVAGARLTARVCDAGTSRTSVLFIDDMETDAKWATTSFSNAAARWSFFTGSSQSGARSLHGPDADTIADADARQKTAIRIPTGQHTYLRFDHSFQMDGGGFINFDGGVVEYTTDGTTWSDAGLLPATAGGTDPATLNGYNISLAPGFGNPLEGRDAFGATSAGYQTTRIDLSTLAGKNVRIRFRVASDGSVGGYGWFVDDVAIYTCGVPAPPPPPPPPSMVPLSPSRLYDSRPTGARPAGSITEVDVTGRGGVPANAGAVVLNVTAVDPQAPGYATVYPCGPTVPDASNLNYTQGQTIPNAVIAKVSTAGTVCIYTYAPTHLLVDVNGYVPPGAGIAPLSPSRLYDSRPTGARPAGSITEVDVTGRGGVPANAGAVVLNVTAVDPQAPGYATVYPCGPTVPDASNLNYTQGQTIPNAVIAKVSTAGTVCIYTYAPTHLLVDVNGYVPTGAGIAPLSPSRLYDSRPTGARPAGSITEVDVTGRGGVPANAGAVVLNVTAVDPQAPGYATVYPCGPTVPEASNLNYTQGQTIPNAVIAKVSTAGTVCIYTYAPTHLLVDVNGYIAPS